MENEISRQWTDGRINCGEGGTENGDIAQSLVNPRRNAVLQDIPDARVVLGNAGIPEEENCSEMTVQFYCPGTVGVSLLTMTWRVECWSTGLSTG